MANHVETQANFARRRGVTQGALAGWKAKGLVVLNAEGLVEIEESIRRLDSRAKYQRRGDRGNKPRQQPPADLNSDPTEETPEDAAERIVKSGGTPHTHAEATRIKENYLALLRQLEFDMKSAEVVPIAVVVAAIVEQYAKVRNKVLSIPTRAAPRVAFLKSAEQVQALLEEEIILALQELSLDGNGTITVDQIRERFAAVH